MTFNAFRLHSEQGLPLTVILHEAKARRIFINLAAFACDAFEAGWTEVRVRRTLEEACADNNIPFSWDEFYTRLAALWTLTGNPHAWDKMKQKLIATQ